MSANNYQEFQQTSTDKNVKVLILKSKLLPKNACLAILIKVVTQCNNCKIVK